jgi:hypothetical protein
VYNSYCGYIGMFDWRLFPELAGRKKRAGCYFAGQSIIKM